MDSADVVAQLGERGYRAAVVPLRYFSDLQEEVEEHHRQGLLDEEFYQEYLHPCLPGDRPDDLPEGGSLIVVAVPRPQFRFVFTPGGEPFPVLVAPTYLGGREVTRQLEKALEDILHPQGYRAAQPVLPKKLLAVRSGLAAYGRNNISFVDGLGSFHGLTAFYSDVPCEQDDWQELRLMDRCEQCRACLHNCPTGAISTERFLLRAERCISYWGEHDGDVAFPEWIDPSWHNCLLGCLRCQSVCPENKHVLGWVEEGAAFSEEETALLLEGKPLDQLPAETVEKLEQSELAYYLSALPRNLGALLSQRP